MIQFSKDCCENSFPSKICLTFWMKIESLITNSKLARLLKSLNPLMGVNGLCGTPFIWFIIYVTIGNFWWYQCFWNSLYRNGLYQKITKCNSRKVHKHNFKPSFSRDKIKWNPYFKRHAINHIVKTRTMVVLMSVSTYVMCVGVYRLIEFLPQITIFNKSGFPSMFSAYWSGTVVCETF